MQRLNIIGKIVLYSFESKKSALYFLFLSAENIKV